MGRATQTYTAKDMFKLYVRNLMKDNPILYFNKSKLELYSLASKDLPTIVAQRENTILVLHELLLEKDTDFPMGSRSIESIKADISDTEIALKAFDKRIQRIQIRSPKTKIIDYVTYRKILTTYNKLATEKVIDGMKLDLLNGLGYIAARRVERNFNNKGASINWGETNKLRDANGNLPVGANGKKVRVYYIDDDWLRIGWLKTSGIKGLGIYSFEPTNSGRIGEGFKKAFTKANVDNPALRLKYDFYPFMEKIRTDTIATTMFDGEGSYIGEFSSIVAAIDYLVNTCKDTRKPVTLKTLILRSCKGGLTENFNYKFRFSHAI